MDFIGSSRSVTASLHYELLRSEGMLKALGKLSNELTLNSTPRSHSTSVNECIRNLDLVFEHFGSSSFFVLELSINTVISQK